MQICRCLEELRELGEPLHLALGVFDGVHLGHQAVISEAVAAAQREGGLAGLLTFDPHPIQVIAPEKAPSALLATLEHKQRIVAALGVELFVPLAFDRELACQEAERFVEEWMAAPVKTVAVGEDWRFGHKRRGDVPMLKREALARGFDLRAVAPVMLEGDRISSTRIRQAISDGNLKAAERMLGRPYSLCGPVIRGRELGRKLGFATANIAVGNSQLPPLGVWTVQVEDAEGRCWKGVANLGMRPTVGQPELMLEVHLLDFSGDLYGEVLDVRFESFLRGEKKFASVEELGVQIRRDVEQARQSWA